MCNIFIENAACANYNKDIFFPIGYKNNEDIPAKKICAKCPSKKECLELAITNREFGIWGGTTEEERSAIILSRSRRKSA